MRDALSSGSINLATRMGSVKSAHRRAGKVKGIDRFLGTLETASQELMETSSGTFQGEPYEVIWGSRVLNWVLWGFRDFQEGSRSSIGFHKVSLGSCRRFQEFQGVSEYSRGLGDFKSSRGFQDFKGASEDIRGLGDSKSSRGFQEFQGVSEYSRGLGDSKSSRGFQEFKGVSEDSRGLGDYRGFQGITGGFRRLQGAHRFSLLINSLINF